MEAVTLYQFELCPFCHKVKAGLELKGVPYRKVEVNPLNKKELPPLPQGSPKKVPVVTLNGKLVEDSTAILKALDEQVKGPVTFLPADPEARAKSEMIEQWVDDDLTYALPTVIYGTREEAFKAAQVTARTSNFGFFQNLMVRAGGSLIMYQVSKRILKKRNQTDGHAWVRKELDRFEGWLGDQPFACGSEPTLADVAVHGALKCIEEFPAFGEAMSRPKLKAWFDRVQKLRDQNRAKA
ncbi:MAG: glutathione S-transferase N-terminal domain-containing protein [Deltaproteobacteria bacterium]|nr:glutathione S-transferase N-terminal domain-containing protein [Deltaproteobacteria bacterium]